MFFVVSVRFSREDLSFPRGVRRLRFCGEVYVGDRVDVRLKGHRGDQEQMGTVCMRSHVAAGTPRRVRLPVSFGMLLTGEILISRSGGEGVVAVLKCSFLSYYPVSVFMSELFSVGTIGRDVRRRFRGSALRALPDAE